MFLSTWAELPELPKSTEGRSVDWQALISLRADVARELEQLRTQGTIGAPLDAEVDIYAAGEHFDTLNMLGEELRFLLITSDARVHKVTQAPQDAVPAPTAAKNGVWLRVTPTSHAKCVRCWHRRKDVGSDPRHPELCVRCVSNVEGPGEQRRYA